MKLLLTAGILAASLLLIPLSARAKTATGTTTMNDETEIQTRGVRNNNPTNLEYHAIGWRGETGSDGRYSRFDSALHGLRAPMINLHTMMTRDNLKTVRAIITRWAPSHENPTDNYVSFVAEKIGLSPDSNLSWDTHVIPMTQAIVEFENGYQPYDYATYESAKAITGR